MSIFFIHDRLLSHLTTGHLHRPDCDSCASVKAGSRINPHHAGLARREARTGRHDIRQDPWGIALALPGARRSQHGAQPVPILHRGACPRQSAARRSCAACHGFRSGRSCIRRSPRMPGPGQDRYRPRRVAGGSEQRAVHPRTRRRIGCAEHVADHREQVGARGDHLRRTAQRDAADRLPPASRARAWRVRRARRVRAARGAWWWRTSRRGDVVGTDPAPSVARPVGVAGEAEDALRAERRTHAAAGGPSSRPRWAPSASMASASAGRH